MQLSHTFSGLTFLIFALTATGMAKPLVAPSDNKPEATSASGAITSDEPSTSTIMSPQQMMDWISNTDAEVTFVGKAINPLAPRSAQDTTVTYCSSRVGGVCGGACTVYTGGTTCLNAPNTNCLMATHNVGFCDRGGCGGSCHDLDTCGTPLDNGFCYTPGTASILVSTA